MTKFHITDQGPRPCTATLKPCPLGGNHFDSLEAAESALSEKHGSMVSVKKEWVSPNSLQGSVTARVAPMAGGHYFGSHIETWTVLPHLDAFRDTAGDDRAMLMELNKELRDRGQVYHMTVVSPPETKKLGSSRTDFPETVKIEYLGVGKASDGKSEAWFIVCKSDDIASWREENNLPPKDLHITLGFDPKDVHTEGKDESTLVVT